jgi:hypothetical protein
MEVYKQLKGITTEVFGPELGIYIFNIALLLNIVIVIRAQISVFRNSQLDIVSKLIWFGWITGLPFLGALFYYLVCKPNSVRSTI